MRTETITTTKEYYQFEELSEQAQEKAIENLSDINVDYSQWAEPELEYFKGELEKVGFIDAKICFSGFYSQGDGACFDAKIDLITFLENRLFMADNYKQAKLYLRWLVLVDNGLFADYSIDRTRYANHYSHEKTRYVDLHVYAAHDCVKEWEMEEMLQMLEECRLDWSKKIYRALESEYEYLTSTEAIKETILANEYEFDVDGNLA